MPCGNKFWVKLPFSRFIRRLFQLSRVREKSFFTYFGDIELKPPGKKKKSVKIRFLGVILGFPMVIRRNSRNIWWKLYSAGGKRVFWLCELALVREPQRRLCGEASQLNSSWRFRRAWNSVRFFTSRHSEVKIVNYCFFSYRRRCSSLTSANSQKQKCYFSPAWYNFNPIFTDLRQVIIGNCKIVPTKRIITEFSQHWSSLTSANSQSQKKFVLLPLNTILIKYLQNFLAESL